MAQENVEIVRRVYEAVSRHDTETVLAAYDADVEYDFSGSPLGILIGATTYHGHEGIRRLVRDRYEAWETIEDYCAELIDAGDHVVTEVVTRGRGRSSGVEVELRHYGAWTLREGKIVRVAWFRTREDALQSLPAT